MDTEAEIQKIKERNARVEADKAWETSHTRRGAITISIYVLSFAVFVMIGAPNPHFVALIPSLAYALSTLTLPFLKEAWLKNGK